MLAGFLSASVHALAVAGFRPWRPLGDWSPMVATNSVAYALAACLSIAAFFAERAASRSGIPGNRPNIWAACSFLLIAFPVAERLDLLFLITEAFRYIFHGVGMYGERRLLQEILLVFMAALGLGLLVRGVRRLGPVAGRYRAALIALSALCGLLMARVVSLHHVDVLMGFEIFPHVKVFGALELLGIAGVALPTGWALVKAARSTVPS